MVSPRRWWYAIVFSILLSGSFRYRKGTSFGRPRISVQRNIFRNIIETVDAMRGVKKHPGSIVRGDRSK